MNLKKHISPISNKHLTRVVSVLSLAALLVLPIGCADDPEDGRTSSTSTMTLIASTDSFFEVNRAMTRALPTGYVPYNELYPTTTPEQTTIGVFMTPERIDATQDFIYMGVDPTTLRPTNKWKSNVRVTEGTTYYMYGFMPKEDAQGAVVTPATGGYANGATLTIQGLSTLTPADVCVIVGVKKGSDTSIPIENSGIKLGEFEYEGGAAGTNSVYLLLKHVYAGLHFKAHLDATYATLRTIKATKFELLADDIADHINLSVTLTPNTTGQDPITAITYTPTSTTSNATIQMFPWANGPTEVEIPVSSPESFLSCFAPGSCNEFTLRTTFNVYDKQNNLIRKDCVVENAINSTLVPLLATMSAGEIYTIDLFIKPTYLYVLSDPDLDNPTITIQ